MVLFIECVVACVIFTLIVIPTLYKNPIKYIMSYPPAIRERIEKLPQYKENINKRKKKHIIVKMIAILVIAAILAIVAFYSGATNFTSSYVHVFTIFFVMNIYDLIVLDIVVFCNSSWVRIPGTEDMDDEYKSPWHHILGAVKGIGIGLIIAFISGYIVYIINKLI